MPEEKQYREKDIAAVHRIVLGAESRLEKGLAERAGLDDDQREEIVMVAVEEWIFDTLDQFPGFSDIVDSIEEKCRLRGVTLFEPE